MTHTKFGSLKTFSAILISTFVLSATPSFAVKPFTAEPSALEQIKNWSVFGYEEGGKKTCFAVSQPTESLPKGVKRGDIFFRVTHREADKSFDSVSVSMGYPLKANSTPTATIGSKTYNFFGQNETIWPAGTASDKLETKLVLAMKGGAKMVVKATSARGTNTTDTYSLAGITAALASAKKHCGM